MVPEQISFVASSCRLRVSRHAYIRAYRIHACIHTSMHTYVYNMRTTYIHAYIRVSLVPNCQHYMHACINTYIHPCIRIYMHAYLHIRMYMHAYIHAYVRVSTIPIYHFLTCMHTYTRIYIHSYRTPYSYTCMHTYIRIYIPPTRACIHTYVYTFMHTYQAYCYTSPSHTNTIHHTCIHINLRLHIILASPPAYQPI